MEFSQALTTLLDGKSLSVIEAESVMNAVMNGELNEAQIAAFLTALRMKGETAEEVAGFVRSMRSHVRRIEAPANTVDTCGTGGDGLHTFNVSTAAGIITAAAGVPVAKHGNRSVSSRCGSADLLETLGVAVDLEPDEASECLHETNFTFLFAPLYHPAMKYAAPVRRALKIRTVFNLLGPLTNPAGVKRQIMGVYDRKILRLVAEAFALLGADHAWVVHGEDGQDELSTTSLTLAFEVKEGAIAETILDLPARMGFPAARLDDLKGGDADRNAEIMRGILAGEKSAYLDAACANAGAAIYISGAAASSLEGYTRAVEAVASGAAREKLEQIVGVSRRIRSGRKG